MPRVLYGYLFRSLALTWLGVVAVLITILTFGQVPQILVRAAENQISRDMIGQVIGWMTLANAPVLLPFGMMLAVVLTMGRFGNDSELTAMRAVGMSPGKLLIPVLLLALPATALQAAIALHLAPDALCSAVKVRAEAVRTLALAPIKPGKFQSFGRDGTLLVEDLGADGELLNIFATVGDHGSSQVMTAARGRIDADLDHDRIQLTLFEGRRYEGVPGEGKFRTVTFGEYTGWFPLPSAVRECKRADSLPTRQLMGSNEPRDRAELNARFGSVAMMLILSLLAAALAVIKPREGRYARLPSALAISLVYLMASIGLTTWSTRQPDLGPLAFWSLHLSMFAAAILLLIRQQRHA